jgi:3-methyladenine DNA glycosylase AlkC
MASLLKDIYSKEFYQLFLKALKEVYPPLDDRKFLTLLFNEQWAQKELKERMKHTSFVMAQVLPNDYKTCTKLIEKLVKKLQENKSKTYALECMFLPDFVETYGLHHFNISVKLMEKLTAYTSCEFAVRKFILHYEQQMIDEMLQWSLHENHHVRRLASEGSRPRLPWAIALPNYKNNPSPILPILHNLKNDPSEYVRRSVANSLNDIAKDNPHIVLDITKKWKGKSLETDALLKHGCRTLLKQGNTEVLKHFGIKDEAQITLQYFKLLTPKVPMGNYLEFAFCLNSQANKSVKIRLEYAMYYLRGNGLHNKKVFKISEREIAPGDSLTIQRKQSFKPISTRRFYPGLHKISLIVNGVEKGMHNFVLTQN